MIRLTYAAIQPNTMMITLYNTSLTDCTVKCPRWNVLSTLWAYVRVVLVTFVRFTLVANEQGRLLFGDIGQIVFVVGALHDVIQNSSLSDLSIKVI